MIRLEAANSSTRAIYIGQSFIEDALVHGKFPRDSVTGPIEIPGSYAWEKPAKVVPEREHMDHWHISLWN
ncbi:hypothetical protein D8B23_07225 [Verminephrobacter aporrectodeae subsp. tuberculatae]|uniref:Uncharacterized protein n=2 Tax=Verminephrobacter TaxID=364316 RepID=A0ABT3KXI2_9BURK|nr:hypothetical protein [Verminephrobacter aporrectodeae subsp. tuberculatae]MCW5323041.1 hypothetical protein [Verminephrobacter aporrectodeae subsp. tuberculatae]MCW8198215.1 hypothetical protein [Verminephrobacter aporrectodeae subsp. tuberculatae]